MRLLAQVEALLHSAGQVDPDFLGSLQDTLARVEAKASAAGACLAELEAAPRVTLAPALSKVRNWREPKRAAG